ncbi:LOW QUALITY PROTEIN: ornithine decarboxylase antizyme 2-like [Brienomyrus brachyistius]|uniref:LOW QUALITY PROTEIN: ornithine decarboxylase antizyme 2-like n=1 Tax=Brienomyrus brachyistius TaxID=42636 RepID=UPI0020B2EABD|nr:LOW QUALITY PROTEIN: ornithine decarboxylase antizyme 2-like [Brienomyrus brachyistius]
MSDFYFTEVIMINTQESSPLVDSAVHCSSHQAPGPLWCSDVPHPPSKIPSGRGMGRDHSFDVLLHKDDRLTVTQTTPVNGKPSVLHFQHRLTEHRASFWEGVLNADSLFLQVPEGELLESSRESLTSLLQFTEENLKVSHVFLWFPKSREDRLWITKTFHYMGFEVVKPGHPLVPAQAGLLFMAYSLDPHGPDEE